MWAVVPVKYLAEAKKRLAGVLTREQRFGLCGAMLSDVLATLKRSPDLAGVVLVSPDPDAELLATKFDCEFVLENELGATGLNAAVDAMVGQLAAAGTDDILIVHGDLPLFNNEELAFLLRAHADCTDPAATIVTDRHGLGSNCVLARPASRLNYCFGEDSLRRHITQARDKGMIANVRRLRGASLDIDTPDDLEQLLAVIDRQAAEHTYGYLDSIGLRAPLAATTDRILNPSPAALLLHQSE